MRGRLHVCEINVPGGIEVLKVPGRGIYALSKFYYQDALREDGKLLAEGDRGAGQDIAPGGFSMKDLGVAVHRQVDRLVRPVEEDEDALAIQATLVDVNALVGHEMFHLAICDDIVSFAPFQQGAEEVPGVVLYLAPARCLEPVLLVAGPAAGHVQADVSIALLLRAVHQQLLPVIKLRDAGYGEEEGHALLESV